MLEILLKDLFITSTILISSASLFLSGEIKNNDSFLSKDEVMLSFEATGGFGHEMGGVTGSINDVKISSVGELSFMKLCMSGSDYSLTLLSDLKKSVEVDAFNNDYTIGRWVMGMYRLDWGGTNEIVRIEYPIHYIVGKPLTAYGTLPKGKGGIKECKFVDASQPTLLNVGTNILQRIETSGKLNLETGIFDFTIGFSIGNRMVEFKKSSDIGETTTDINNNDARYSLYAFGKDLTSPFIGLNYMFRYMKNNKIATIEGIIVYKCD
ncbi:hypothetical protein TI10_05090 [Photorhabdus luminescens subsp. luminescens]|uniref:Uncharacterized protein n=1 Tax=Photorhabdus luminescens TaxID=29488 RepID=A0A1G5Q3I2_PHOLU|nr:hypothetical protein [Photorhabdus luminescens]KMW73632.1 hypothetical protein TI10_05090 [Photorhabdus luminescens subsp. luminescens]SCZ55951.1 hypothetical protein SAMN02982990_00853 [Photorhabdus luminescens]